MAGAVGDVVLGLIASFLSGLAVWLWHRGKQSRDFRVRTRVVGARPGDTCLLVMNNVHDAPGSTQHHDVQALIEAAVLAHGLDCETEVVNSDDFHGSNGDRPEFCIGGPRGSNVRSAGHLAENVPGVVFHAYHHPDHPLAIEAGGETYLWNRGADEYALIAKFTCPGGNRPVLLICGQSALGNHAAAYFLRRSYREIAATVAATERFCLLVRIPSIATYGFHGVRLERDLTSVAFTSPAAV
ncbi:hypothetical protein [Streptomyces sp. NPDC048002]|uniref:hypothetical protein n=1 Tax=unclassified Streptomyces TaxID=2593676 RepID=UPI0033F8684A